MNAAAIANYIFFGLIVVVFAGLSAAFFYGYKLRRDAPALYMGVVSLWPIVHAAREMRWLPRAPTTAFLALGLAVGILGWVLLWVGGRSGAK